MIAVVGAGAWGTALAQTLRVAGADVRLWARDPALAAGIARQRRNPAYLPNIALDPGIEVTSDLPAAVEDAAVAILAVPTHGLRAVTQACAEHLADGCAVVSAAKGLETGSGLRMTEVLESVLGAGRPVAALSGPNIALEVARGLPAAAVVAAADRATAENVRDALNGPRLRIYSNEDVVGVELGGALKNVVAIAAGIGDGVGAGDNGKAALVTRGLAEMARLGIAMGARAITFAGLTGLGDCFVTCISPHSRNRRLGELIGRGQSLAEVQAGMFQVAEGVNAARAARLLSQRHGVEMPIVDAVCAVLFEGKPLDAALTDLMTRGARDELSELWPA